RCELPDEEEFERQQALPYVIISHAWQQKEVVFEDMPYFARLAASPSWSKSRSANKIKGACQAVRRMWKGEITHLWLDNICIDKKNLTELSMSINSMYHWYEGAAACFVYLEDFPSVAVPEFTKSRWFTRGWTLQELVAPRKVVFFDKDWNVIGDKVSLRASLTGRTKISNDFLLHKQNIGHASISQRMSWFSGRETTVPEDTAYCLLGLFGVNMPLLYGEGRARAFRRLQEEIMRYSDDQTLFAWRSIHAGDRGSGLLAESPDHFQQTGDYITEPDRLNNRPFQMTNKVRPSNIAESEPMNYVGLCAAAVDN
ncbi:MAG: hypothetical protein Q9218_007974, partial [Villophora microphyllina]